MVYLAPRWTRYAVHAVHYTKALESI